MIRIHPFAALRPPASFASEVASDPYDVISTEEAVERATGKPRSFLHVVRSEIDLPADSDCHAAEVYAQADRNLHGMIAAGSLVRDAFPGLYLYRQVREGRAQTGIVCCVETAQYETGEIRKHEKTRPDKEDDRTRHLLATACHAEPVFLCFRDRPGLVPGEGTLAARMGADTATTPVFDFVAPDGVRHVGWRITDPAGYVAACRGLDLLYIADGHHRSAGAARAAQASAAVDPKPSHAAEYGRFLAVVFPHDQLRILPYNRVVRDLAGMTATDFLDRLRTVGNMRPAQAGIPAARGEVLVFVDGGWWSLTFPPASIDRSDPIANLDVSLLQDRVLAPLLGISDPRSDGRIEFVGGIRGTAELERRAGAEGVAFSMHATSPDELLAVADAGEIMPPKSTWFEPKLRSGLFVHEFERMAGASG
ncbi:MAG: DUF1015 domain-containing protein [Planctomycetes bacterium]|nr:DUF1015 domain-containing protein [Planctomycetota bacterium]